jgi:DNA-binding response OmpR family regulator
MAGKMPKVMLIEDDANMFSLLRMLLEFEGYEVVQWDRGEKLEDVISVLKIEKPDLVLLDVHLRHLNGFDVLGSMRKEPSLSDIRVLMASGMDMTYRSKQEGANGFILKPFMPDELIQKIQQTLG